MAGQPQKRPKVYQKEFVRGLADRVSIGEAEAEKLTEAFLETIKATLVEHESVCFPTFGIFELRESGQRVGRNPMTMEECIISETTKPVFRASKALRDRVSEAVRLKKEKDKSEEDAGGGN